MKTKEDKVGNSFILKDRSSLKTESVIMEHLERFLRNTLVETENDEDRIHSDKLGEAVRRHLGDWTNSSMVDSFNRIHPDVPGNKVVINLDTLGLFTTSSDGSTKKKNGPGPKS